MILDFNDYKQSETGGLFADKLPVPTVLFRINATGWHTSPDIADSFLTPSS